jgi:mRNA-capping enzyme
LLVAAMSKRQRDNGPGPMPKRWIRCPIKSDDFIINKFVAFKTPLSERFDPQVVNNSFYPYMLFNLIKDYYKVS